jgi:pterin-4a-carbinolamine dehydratase
MIQWYSATAIIDYFTKTGIVFPESGLPHRKQKWVNCGGQIINQDDLTTLLSSIKSDPQINTWDNIHERFDNLNKSYDYDKYIHALGCLASVEEIAEKSFTMNDLKNALQKVIPVCKKITELTCQSRLKDYTDPYRTFVYDSDEEMNAVLGKFDDDTVIRAISEEMQTLTNSISAFVTRQTAQK